MSLDLYLGFVLASVILIVIPGPNVALIVANSVAHGARFGLLTVAGTSSAVVVHLALTVLGASVVLNFLAASFDWLRWLGVAYLLWLAWEAWTANADDASADPQLDRSLGEAFRRGLITNLLNPKAAIFYLAVVPDFIVPTGSVAAQTLTLAAIYVAIATGVHSLIVMLASRLATHLNDARRRRLVSRSLALALVAIAVWFAVSTMR
jgi:threonine/homoserine/homoserine lactone efflux protein